MLTCILSIALALHSEPEPVSVIQVSSSGFADLEAVASEIRGKQVVQLGEATHGGAEFYRLKTRIVKWLHERHGFNMIAIEAGVIEAGFAGLNRRDKSPTAMVSETLFGPMRWQESLALMDYLKANPKLKLIGVDPQFSSDAVLDNVKAFLAQYDLPLADQCYQRLGEGYGYMGKGNEPEEFRRQRDSYLAFLTDLQTKLAELKPKSADRAKSEFLSLAIKSLRRYWNFEPDTPATERFALRDRLMYENLVGQLAGEKVIVWAHNGHLGRGIGHRVLGDHLADQFKGKNYSLGLFARSGQYFQHWTNDVREWQAPQGGLETSIVWPAPAAFRSSRAYNMAVSAFEPENGGTIEFVPARRFDALIVIDRITPPTRLSGE